MALIPPFFLNCVVSIGLRPIQEPAKINWIGTGFIVGRPLEGVNNEKQFHTFLVTNKHVLLNQQSIVIRFDSTLGLDAKDYDINLIKGGVSIWTGHKSNNVDVAVINLNPAALQDDGADLQFFQMDEHLLSVNQMRSEGVSEGDGVFILGFPMGIVAPQKKNVIARVGAIARIRDTLEGSESTFLIDANIFPGNSGGPVIIKPEMISIQETKSINKSFLIGIVKSYLPFMDTAISQLTGRPRVIFEENSGLALVESVDSIKETIEDCYQNLVLGQKIN